MAGIALLPLIGTAISAVGTIAGGAAANSAAQAQAQMSQFKARQAEIAAGEARAAGQRKAIDARHEGTLAQSKLQAQAAASGGGAADPTIVKLGERIAGRGELGALNEMYKGESQARGLLDQAALDRMAAAAALSAGEDSQTRSYFTAGGSLLHGLGSAFDKYNTSTASNRRGTAAGRGGWRIGGR